MLFFMLQPLVAKARFAIHPMMQNHRAFSSREGNIFLSFLQRAGDFLGNMAGSSLRASNYDVVHLPKNSLKFGYKHFHEAFFESLHKALGAGSFSGLAAGYLTYLSQDILGCLFSSGGLLAGGVAASFYAKEALEIYRSTQRSIPFSSLTGGPSRFEEENKAIIELLQKGPARVFFTYSGFSILGRVRPSLVGDSPLITQEKIKNLRTVTIPFAALSKHVPPISLPSIFWKGTTDVLREIRNGVKSPFDLYPVFCAPWEEERKKINALWKEVKNPEEIMQIIVDGHNLREGAEYLSDWVQNQKGKLNITVNSFGQIVLTRQEAELIALPEAEKKHSEGERGDSNNRYRIPFLFGSALTLGMGIRAFFQKIEERKSSDS